MLVLLAQLVASSGCSNLAPAAEPPPTDAAPQSVNTPPADPSLAVAPAADPRPSPRSAATRLSVNLHLFGLSYHPDQKGVRKNNLDNEINYGLGINYEYANDDQGVSSTEVGFFKDSGNNWAKFAGFGYQFKLGSRLKLGADLLAVHSPT